MIFAVASDIHDQLGHWRALWPRLSQGGAEALILCGDIGRIDTLRALKPAGLPWAFCLGNCDRECAEALKEEAVILGARAWGDVGLWSLEDGGAIAFTHFPAVARRLAYAGAHRAVFYGHTHKPAVERLQGPQGEVLLANPGDVERRYGRISGLLWDSTTGALRSVEA